MLYPTMCHSGLPVPYVWVSGIVRLFGRIPDLPAGRQARFA
jgi:hypothetical protein